VARATLAVTQNGQAARAGFFLSPEGRGGSKACALLLQERDVVAERSSANGSKAYALLLQERDVVAERSSANGSKAYALLLQEESVAAER